MDGGAGGTGEPGDFGRKEYGDFQTPLGLAGEIVGKLGKMGVAPSLIVEPTAGVGAFAISAAKCFGGAKVLAYDVNPKHLERLRQSAREAKLANVETRLADFFKMDWQRELAGYEGDLLVLGNLPWVTNSAMGSMGGANLPQKSNFAKLEGLDAIMGKSNFDVSQWMMEECLGWFAKRRGHVAMLIKTAVARKLLGSLEKAGSPLQECHIWRIDAKRHFGVAVDACLAFFRMDPTSPGRVYDAVVHDDLNCEAGRLVGRRDGIDVADLALYERRKGLLAPGGDGGLKWRSGVKHDLARALVLKENGDGTLSNALGETLELENELLYPLMRGADVANGAPSPSLKLLLPQRRPGEDVEWIGAKLPKTWLYLESKEGLFESRKSSIYRNGGRFGVFGVGDYTFRPWKVAISSLHKEAAFRLVGPIGGKPALFDDTVYFISFDTRDEAEAMLSKLKSREMMEALMSMVFIDDKRPYKAGILNRLKLL